MTIVDSGAAATNRADGSPTDVVLASQMAQDIPIPKVTAAAVHTMRPFRTVCFFVPHQGQWAKSRAK
jgi:hypothetical protein